jgi:hypothetical protein
MTKLIFLCIINFIYLSFIYFNSLNKIVNKYHKKKSKFML